MSNSAASPTIANLLTITQEYPAPPIVARACRQQNWAEECRRSLEDPDGFWGEHARRFKWTQPWQHVMEFDGVHHRWFVGGKTNITINALDRHAESSHCNRVAYIWLGE